MSTPASVLVQKHRGINVARTPFNAGNNPNQNFVYDVPRGGYIGRQTLTIRGSLVVSAGSASGTSLGENPGGLIQRVIVEASPAGQIKSLGPRSLVRSTLFQFRRLINDAALTGAAGTFVMQQPFYLHYAMPNRPSPYESALQTDRFASIQIRVQGGGRDTQFTGNDRTFDFTGLTLDFSQLVEYMAGQTALVFEDDLIQQITSVNPNFAITAFPLGQRYDWQAYYFETTNQQLADTIMNRATVQSSGLVFWDAMFDEQRVWDRALLSDDDTSSPLVGCAFAQLNPDWTLNGAVDMRYASQLISKLDVNNPGTDRVIVHSSRVLLPADMPS
jgi:hypothetical protein